MEEAASGNQDGGSNAASNMTSHSSNSIAHADNTSTALSSSSTINSSIALNGPIMLNGHTVRNGSTAVNGSTTLPVDMKSLSVRTSVTPNTFFAGNDVVVLNVGGFEYTTLQRTLLKVPALVPMFQNNESTAIKDSKGRYFIDRDGRLFSYILQYLRTGVSLMPETVTDVDMLRIEVDYYKLEEFGRKLTEHSKRLRAQKDNHDIVKINVGGRSFVTTRRTMIAYPNSLLARIFNGNQPNEYFYNGEVFFDRDPELFGHILQFLRNKTLSYSCTSIESKDFLHNLLCEARFFKLQDLIGICMSLIRYCDQG